MNSLTAQRILSAQAEMRARLANTDWFRAHPDPRNPQDLAAYDRETIARYYQAVGRPV